MITGADFLHLVAGICEAGYGDDIQWQEAACSPVNEDEFAREAIFVICNSGMRFTVAQGIFDRVMVALADGKSARTAFGHPGKAAAIDEIWTARARWFDRWMIEPATVEQQIAFCETLPWIGPTTKYHLAKNFGVQVAKPDVHLKRLADAEGTTAQQLCERLAGETGYKVPTVDVVLWRACAIGLIKSRDLVQ